MKKKILLLILSLILIPTFVFAKDTCNDNDIKIKSISLKELNGFSEEVQESSINNNTINLNLKMYDVGDSSTYYITVENTSDEDYYFTKDSMKLENDYLEYSLRNDSEVIPAKNEKTIELKVSYKNKISNDSYSDTSKLIISLSNKPLNNPETKMNYTFIFIIIILIAITIYTKINKKSLSKKKLLLVLTLLSIIPINTTALCTVNLNVETKIEIENKEAIFLPGSEVNIKMKELAGDDTSTVTNGYNFLDQNIISIKYSNFEPIASNKEEKNIVSTPDSPYPIYMWFEDGTIYWWSEDIHPNLNSNSMAFMLNLLHLNNIDSISMWDASNIINMQSMFYGTSLKNLSALKDWDVSSVNNLIYTFSHMDLLTDIRGLSNWNIANVESLQNTFSFDTTLKNLNGIEKWNTSKVKSMNLTFAMNSSLTSTTSFKNWDTSSVEMFSSMFGLDESLIDLSGLSNWNVSNAKDYMSMFAGCTSITNLSGLENWNVSKAESFINMFINCRSLEDVSFINNWDISKTASFSQMFRNVPTHPEFTKIQGMWSSGTFTPTP